MKTVSNPLGNRINATGPRYGILFFAVLLTLVGARVHAITIDFGAFPDGTLASGGNLYGGVLNINAQGLTPWEGCPSGGVMSSGTVVQEASVQGGVLAVVPPPVPDGTGVSWAYHAQLTATFSRPVVDVSFQAYCYRYAVYTYTGVDGTGASFNGLGYVPGLFDGAPDGSPPASGWATFDLSIPSGGYLTGFSIGNRDPKPGDAAFWVNDISFNAIPDTGSTLLLLLFSCVGLLWGATRSSNCPD